jgi:two-component system, chemotaxis family, chemotaxis protein CheY
MVDHATTNPAASTSRARSVLIVEDNDVTRDRMSRVLRGAGYQVTEAVDGLDALKKVSASRFDAILLDLILPHVDGWQFRATQLRHPELATIPTVIVTIQPLREPDRYSLRTTDIVHKPFDDADLVEAVRRACERHQPAVASPVAATSRLFWSRHGEIACAQHAPEPDSHRWREERWAPIRPAADTHRIVYQCQHCPGHGSPIDRSRRTAS